jgi:hypothetical protein
VRAIPKTPFAEPNATKALNIGGTLRFSVISSVAAGSKPYGPQEKKLFTSGLYIHQIYNEHDTRTRPTWAVSVVSAFSLLMENCRENPG